MVKKAGVKKKSVRRIASKKTIKKPVKRKSGATKSRQVRASKRKIHLVLKNLILFAVLSLVSFLLYRVSSNDLLINLFYLLAIVLGFVAGAFLIILLVFFFLRIMKK